MYVCTCISLSVYFQPSSVYDTTPPYHHYYIIIPYYHIITLHFYAIKQLEIQRSTVFFHYSDIYRHIDSIEYVSAAFLN